MQPLLCLASASQIRAQMLTNAGIPFEQRPARVDETALRASFDAEGVAPRDQADLLAEFKAKKAASSTTLPVLGADQILVADGTVYGKPNTIDQACAQLALLAGRRHRLYSAAVLCEQGRPVWRHVSQATLFMKPLTHDQIEVYVRRTWASIQNSVGCYKIEEEGVRLFSRIDGDHFTILGLPLLPLLTYLSDRGMIDP